jgi:hypothetical protein
MGFDFAAARAIVAKAKESGLIRPAGSEPTTPGPVAELKRSEREDNILALPDWLLRGLREPK